MGSICIPHARSAIELQPARAAPLVRKTRSAGASRGRPRVLRTEGAPPACPLRQVPRRRERERVALGCTRRRSGEGLAHPLISSPHAWVYARSGWWVYARETGGAQDELRAAVARAGREAAWLAAQRPISACLAAAVSARATCHDARAVRAVALCAYGPDASVLFPDQH